MKLVQVVQQGKRELPTAGASERFKSSNSKTDLALEVVSASVPRHIVMEVKKRVGKRGFSQFVTRSLERELQRANQRSFIAEAEDAVGPLDPKSVARAQRLIRS